MKRFVTIAMAVYGQPKMLEVWFDTLRSYSKEILDQLELVIVDDHGTPEVGMIPEDIRDLMPCQLFRVQDNIAWNQPGARNLALEHIKTKMVLFVDPDMVFPEAMMASMLDEGWDLPENRIIRFCLRHRIGARKGVLDKSSPNTWFMHTSSFKRVGGYDEDFCGHKGWSDVQLLDVFKAAFKIRQEPELFAEFYDNEEISDASVQTLDRSSAHNRKLRIRNVKAARMIGGWLKFVKQKGEVLRFRWEQLL